MERHIDDNQIDALLLLHALDAAEPGSWSSASEDAKAHLEGCEACQARIREREAAMVRLVQLKPDAPSAAGPECPPDDVWIEIAAGLRPDDAGELLGHAIQCDHCGPMLREATEDFAENLTPDEAKMIAALKTANSAWQTALAAELSGASIPRRDQPLVMNRWRSFLAWSGAPARLAFAGAVVAISLGAWWLVARQSARTPDRLLASAYAEKRTIELRIDGAPYVPMRQERGDEMEKSRLSRPALLKAEAEIAAHLESAPDNIAWLQASGRASLLEGGLAGTEQAVAVLEKAHELEPDNRSASVDLASAYLLRGEMATRPEDEGTAVDLLGRVLAADPQNETAQFNYAIALDKLNLKAQALDAWQKFLQSHGSSPWSVEARQRMQQLQQEIRNHSRRSDQPLESVEQVAAAVRQRGEDLAPIDARIEEYQDAAVQQWLPAYFDAPGRQAASQVLAKTALDGVAQLLRDRHQDRWLADLLSSAHSSPRMRDAVDSLAESERLVLTSNEHGAEEAANRAATLFQQASRAGELRARLDLALIEQLEHKSLTCETLAHSLTHSTQSSGYAWLRIQSRLEEAACASTSDERAARLAVESARIAQKNRYPILLLRAANFESGSCLAAGDRHGAWTNSIDSLRQFWDGAFPASRGYSLLTNLHDLAEEQQQAFLEAAVLKEAVPMIATDPDTAMRAFEEDRLGEAQLRSDDVLGAESSFAAARQIFAGVAPGARRDALNAETEVGLARAELDRGEPADAVRRLEQIRPSIAQIADADLQLDFFQTSGIAHLRSGLVEQAKPDLMAAIQAAEKGLRFVEGEADRWRWRRRNEGSYRALVELELESNPVQAFCSWERFKGATLRIEKGAPPSAPRELPAHVGANVCASLVSAMAPDVSYLVFDMMPGKAAVWVMDGKSIRQMWIPLPGHPLALQIRRFSEHCSEPGSDPGLLRREAAALYKTLVLPVEPWIAGNRSLMIEPDGDLRSVPFEILVDAQGQYLGDRYAVTVSPGIEYLRRSRVWTGISAAADASILGNPAAPGWVPLPAAELEARSIAALFSHPRLRLGQAVSNASLIQEIDRAQLFHFAGHASASVQSAGLVMDGSHPSEAFRVEDARSGRTQLAVLSACNSAIGSAGFFDDEDSFVRRLMGAGVPSVVASRWMVDSAATSQLMQSFYASLLAGRPVSVALAEARRQVRAQPQFAHPFYWAGFSAFGRS